MTWAFVRFGLLVGAAVPLALRQADLWEKPPGRLLVACLLTIALVGAGEPFIERVRARAQRVASEQVERTRQVMLMSLADVAHRTSLLCEDVGVHLFLVQHRFPRRFREATLTRLLRVRLSSDPSPSSVDWTRGKGVVGTCWAQERDVTVDLDELHNQYYGCSQQLWETLPARITLGLSFRDFERTQAKYGVIIATPMTRSSGEVVGVVAIDGPCAGSSALDSGPVRKAIRKLADDLQRHLNR